MELGVKWEKVIHHRGKHHRDPGKSSSTNHVGLRSIAIVSGSGHCGSVSVCLCRYFAVISVLHLLLVWEGHISPF